MQQACTGMVNDAVSNIWVIVAKCHTFLSMHWTLLNCEPAAKNGKKMWTDRCVLAQKTHIIKCIFHQLVNYFCVPFRNSKKSNSEEKIRKTRIRVCDYPAALRHMLDPGRLFVSKQ